MSPLDLGFLARVVNVHWGGVVFIFITSNAVYRINIGSKNVDATNGDTTPQIETVTLPGDANNYVFRSCSYAVAGSNKTTGARGTPTFAIIANEDFEGPSHGYGLAVVFTSNDGITWRKTFISTAGEDLDADVTYEWQYRGQAIVWHPSTEKFVLNQLWRRGGLPPEDTPGGPTSWTREQWFSSSSGESWSGPAYNNQTWFTQAVGVEHYNSTFPTMHCAHNDCKDHSEFTNHVPDGYIGYDTNKKILMRPAIPPIISYGDGNISFADNYFGLPTNGKLEIVRYPAEGQTAGTLSKSIPGVTAVTCAAGANGIWLVGGTQDPVSASGGRVAFSVDDGETWKVFEQSFPYLIYAMCGGSV